MDCEEKLGLSTDSILYYAMDSSVKRVPGMYIFITAKLKITLLLDTGSSSIPHCSPYYALGQKMTISIILKGKIFKNACM